MKKSKNGNFSFEEAGEKSRGYLGTIFYSAGYNNSFIKVFKACFYVHNEYIPLNTEFLEFLEEIREELKQ